MVASTLTFSPSSVVVMTAFMVESVRSTPLMYPTRVPKAFLGNPINNNYQTFIKFLELNLKIIPAILIRDIEADYTCSKDHPIKTTLFILLSLYSCQFFFCSVWSTKHYASSSFVLSFTPPFFLQGGDIYLFSVCLFVWPFSEGVGGGAWLTGTWGQTAKIPLNFVPCTISPTILGRAAGATALPVSHPTGLWAGGPSPPHTPLSVHWKKTKIKVKIHPDKLWIIYGYADFLLWNILKM